MLRCFLSLAFCWVFAAAAFCQAPYPFLHPAAVVLFQGDSITDGGRWRTGQDLNHIMGQDYAYILSARLGVELASRDLIFINRGIGGDHVPDMAARWKTDTLDLRPDVLSILVGVNDTLSPGPQGESVEQYQRGYDALLAQTTAALPGVKIVLGEPFLLPVGKHKANYAAELAQIRQRQAVVQQLGQKYHLPVVLYQDAFDAACRTASPEHWSWDGVHPTYAGHWLMAESWLETTAAFWKN